MPHDGVPAMAITLISGRAIRYFADFLDITRRSHHYDMFYTATMRQAARAFHIRVLFSL